MSKEDLIYTLLRSEKIILEDNYMKYINNNTDNELHARINSIRIAATKLGNILINEERKIIREELYRLEDKKRFTRAQREKAYTYLIDLARTLDNKEKYQYSDYHDQDYLGIRDIENMLNNIDDIDYYKPILTKESFVSNYQYHEISGDRYKYQKINH